MHRNAFKYLLCTRAGAHIHNEKHTAFNKIKQLELFYFYPQDSCKQLR